MTDLGKIRRLSREACNRAKRHGMRPRVPTDAERIDLAKGQFGTFRFPNLGEYVPSGWEHIETYFVDKSGWGSEYGPALTRRTLAQRLADRPAANGFAMIEEGPFQCYVGEFAPKAKRARQKPEVQS